MKLGDVLSLMSCKDGRELYYKVEEILKSFGVDARHGDGPIKNLYELCCDVAEVLNKEK
jgi:hypothetical protein